MGPFCKGTRKEPLYQKPEQEDPVKEKRRQDAIRAYKNRMKIKQAEENLKSALEDLTEEVENLNIKKEGIEKNIQMMERQQSQHSLGAMASLEGEEATLSAGFNPHYLDGSSTLLEYSSRMVAVDTQNTSSSPFNLSAHRIETGESLYNRQNPVIPFPRALVAPHFMGNTQNHVLLPPNPLETTVNAPGMSAKGMHLLSVDIQHQQMSPFHLSTQSIGTTNPEFYAESLNTCQNSTNPLSSGLSVSPRHFGENQDCFMQPHNPSSQPTRIADPLYRMETPLAVTLDALIPPSQPILYKDSSNNCQNTTNSFPSTFGLAARHLSGTQYYPTLIFNPSNQVTGTADERSFQTTVSDPQTGAMLAHGSPSTLSFIPPSASDKNFQENEIQPEVNDDQVRYLADGRD